MLFSVYLGKVTAVTRTALPNSTTVRYLGFTWVRLRQSRKQRYPFQPHLFFHLHSSPGFTCSMSLAMSVPGAGDAVVGDDLLIPNKTAGFFFPSVCVCVCGGGYVCVCVFPFSSVENVQRAAEC